MADRPKHTMTGFILTGLGIMLLLLMTCDPALAARCTPTPWDEIGPFYRPNAPVRNTIGKGYLLSGTVRSADGCRPLHNARIEIWQVGPDGTYDDAHPMDGGRLTSTSWWMRRVMRA